MWNFNTYVILVIFWSLLLTYTYLFSLLLAVWTYIHFCSMFKCNWFFKINIFTIFRELLLHVRTFNFLVEKKILKIRNSLKKNLSESIKILLNYKSNIWKPYIFKEKIKIHFKNNLRLFFALVLFFSLSGTSFLLFNMIFTRIFKLLA